jgi:hypothetical protein
LKFYLLINEVLHDANGVEQEAIGIDFLTKLNWLGYLETNFLQQSWWNT